MSKAVATALVALMVGVMLMVPGHETQASFSLFGAHKHVKEMDGKIQIPLNKVDDGKAHYFKYEQGGTTIKFFVVQSNDGVIRAAFDACDVCFPEKKGYSQDGDFMICNNCGRRFHSSRINVVEGGCNPAPLRREVVGDQLVIKTSDVMPGARYF